MAGIITNKAIVNFKAGADSQSVESNTATTSLQGPIEIVKKSLETSYHAGENLTYTVIVKNTGTSALTNLMITDDLGTYTLAPGTDVTPLTYVGPASEYVNHVYIGQLVPTINADNIVFTITNLAGGSTLLLNYKVLVNEYALPAPGSTIKNTVHATADGQASVISADHTIPAATYTDLRITKSMEPDPVLDGATLTYRFLLENYGNQDATEVSLVDTFNPLPTTVAATMDGIPTTDFDFTGTPEANEFHFPKSTVTSTTTVPAARFSQDPATGVITVTPGSHVLVVTGII